MAKLQDLFTQKKTNIYNKLAPSQNQFIVIKPDTNEAASRIKDDTQAIPVVSTSRDILRIRKFLSSSTGVLFTRKQALLQAGNIFQNTRLYNPVSPVLNAVPFIHAQRHIPVGVVRSIFLNPNLPGVLQKDTVTTVASNYKITNKLAQVNLSTGQFIRTVAGAAATYLRTQLKRSIPLPSAQNFYTSRPEYNVFGYDVFGQLRSLNSTGAILFDMQPLSQRGIQKRNVIANIKAQAIARTAQAIRNNLSLAFTKRNLGEAAIVPGIVGQAGAGKIIRDPLNGKLLTREEYERRKPNIDKLGKQEDKITSFVVAAKQFRDNFYNKTVLKNIDDKQQNVRKINRLESSYFNEASLGGGAADITDGTNPIRFDNEPTKYASVNDPLNKTVTTQDGKVRIDPTAAYTIYTNSPVTVPTTTRAQGLGAEIITAPRQKSDIINFSFDNGNLLVFRAFISSIKEAVKPEFNEQRYVGRTERFVTYGGAKRSLSLTFNLAAFSSDEIDLMWKRVNFLTGLAFPTGIKNGFMIPPLCRISIGGIYENQPCYVESLDYDFLDDSIVFDIDKEVPTVINVSMQLSLLEKRSKFYNTPFYKITEDISVPPPVPDAV